MRENDSTTSGFGIPQKEEEYLQYMNKPIRIYSVNTCYLGVLHSIINGNLFLLPVYIAENLYNPDGSTLPRSRIERNIPTTIPRSGIMGIEPLSENYLEELVSSVNSIRPRDEVKNSRDKSVNPERKKNSTISKKK